MIKYLCKVPKLGWTRCSPTLNESKTSQLFGAYKVLLTINMELLQIPDMINMKSLKEIE